MSAHIAPAAIAFSYIRFSTRGQEVGDSVRRQTEAAEDWCRHNRIPLDSMTTFRDFGTSAFKGKHHTLDRSALTAFLGLVEDGQVPRGSYLIIENLDRLSREDEVPATYLLTGMLMKGIRIVQLFPSELILTDRSDAYQIMRAVMELSRGASESRAKSERLYRLWERKRRDAREGRVVLTGRLPLWIERRNGKLRLIPSRARVVRRIFALCAAGYGHLRILQTLMREGVEPFGSREPAKNGDGRTRFQRASVDGRYASGYWRRGYLRLILQDRRVLGEYQPRSRGTPTGAPISNYYPAAVSEKEWKAARRAAERRLRRGNCSRVSHLDLFSRLLWDARGGCTYFRYTRTMCNRVRRQMRVIMNSAAMEGRAPARSFPLDTLERGILALLKRPWPVREANGRKMARAESWQILQALAHIVDTSREDRAARVRLRLAMRRSIDSIWVLVIGRGRDRVCVAQIIHVGGTAGPSVYILHRPPKSNVQAGGTRGRRVVGGWWCFSEGKSARKINLRVERDVALLEHRLSDDVFEAVAAEQARWQQPSNGAKETVRKLGRSSSLRRGLQSPLMIGELLCSGVLA
jgi:DNA invertase Pin-like site-specific DNA recombinase